MIGFESPFSSTYGRGSTSRSEEIGNVDGAFQGIIINDGSKGLLERDALCQCGLVALDHHHHEIEDGHEPEYLLISFHNGLGAV